MDATGVLIAWMLKGQYKGMGMPRSCCRGTLLRCYIDTLGMLEILHQSCRNDYDIWKEH